MATRPTRIVSGGQTGVDRAALDAAIAAAVPHGGWCPAGRRAEDGEIPPKYDLTEMASESYIARTRQNVADSDGTLILTRGAPRGGTRATAEHADKIGRPLWVTDFKRMIDPDAEIAAILDWMAEHDIETLNVAGPRESTGSGIYREAQAFMEALLAA